MTGDTEQQATEVRGTPLTDALWDAGESRTVGDLWTHARDLERRLRAAEEARAEAVKWIEGQALLIAPLRDQLAAAQAEQKKLIAANEHWHTRVESLRTEIASSADHAEKQAPGLDWDDASRKMIEQAQEGRGTPLSIDHIAAQGILDRWHHSAWTPSKDELATSLEWALGRLRAADEACSEASNVMEEATLAALDARAELASSQHGYKLLADQAEKQAEELRATQRALLMRRKYYRCPECHVYFESGGHESYCQYFAADDAAIDAEPEGR